MMNGQGNSNSHPIDEIFSNLFNMRFSSGSNLDENSPFGQSFPFGQGSPFGQGTPFGQGFPFGQNIRIFHNGVPINIQGMNQKPGPIVKHY